ncbi:HAD-IIB family hydrolase [Oceanobacillus sp. J11TS1]|uniref:HAD-IIB family hydrolase n=1 Tax=Oceanobacillus sp. J11TS1 TaxID=2807191 RepID=UPI001B0A8BB2|nr:HAD family hydrolase [Oceanobacillus sp. J11TS1]GIO23775.1 Cof-type HAD-IIB family hydrolase [Oceanobacillus sp. J11TS1]
MNFVFDIDGTICFDGKTIDPAILQALEEIQTAGHQVIFASARPIRDIIPVLPKSFQQGKLVGGNGGYTASSGKIGVTHFQDDLLTNLIEMVEANQLTYLADSDWDYAFNGLKTHPIYKNINQSSAQNKELRSLDKVCKLVLFQPPQQVIDELSALPVNITYYKGENAIDISPVGINKVSGLHNVQVREFIAFGNDSNDQCLFENALYSVCVGEHEVKKYASISIQKEELPATIRNVLGVLENKKAQGVQV